MSSTTNTRSTNGQSRRIIPFTAWTMTQPLLVVMSAFVLTMTLVGTQPVESKPLVEKPPLALATVKPAKEIKATLSDVAAISDTYVAPAPAKPVAQAVVVGTSDAMQFIFQHESGGRLDAVNHASGSCGIGQALPCSKLANVCPDWRTNNACQVQFFTSYAMSRYGSWDAAMGFWQQNRWW